MNELQTKAGLCGLIQEVEEPESLNDSLKDKELIVSKTTEKTSLENNFNELEENTNKEEKKTINDKRNKPARSTIEKLKLDTPKLKTTTNQDLRTSCRFFSRNIKDKSMDKKMIKNVSENSLSLKHLKKRTSNTSLLKEDPINLFNINFNKMLNEDKVEFLKRTSSYRGVEYQKTKVNETVYNPKHSKKYLLMRQITSKDHKVTSSLLKEANGEHNNSGLMEYKKIFQKNKDLNLKKYHTFKLKNNNSIYNFNENIKDYALTKRYISRIMDISQINKRENSPDQLPKSKSKFRFKNDYDF